MTAIILTAFLLASECQHKWPEVRQLSGPLNLVPGMERQYTELNVLGPLRLMSSGYPTTASALSSCDSWAQ